MGVGTFISSSTGGSGGTSLTLSDCTGGVAGRDEGGEGGTDGGGSPSGCGACLARSRAATSGAASIGAETENEPTLPRRGSRPDSKRGWAMIKYSTASVRDDIP